MNQTRRQNAPVANVGEPVANLCRAAETLCRAVAGRDLGDTPLYIVTQSSLPPECGSGDQCYGFTTPSLDLYLADHIPNYRGRGPCMVINDVALTSDLHPADLRYVVPALVVHELAHILERPTLYEDRTGVDPERIQFEALVVADAGTRPPRVDLPAYFGHGESFIRTALHLCHRAETAGVSIRPGAICNGFRHGLSHASDYQEALGDEPERMANMLFREILASLPPPEFTHLWTTDVFDYHERFPQLKGTNP